MKEILHFEDITFRREGREILKGVNWRISKGENWALLGLNGCGKSTLLGMIPAYTYPTTGDVHVFGHTYGKYIWERVKNKVGFVSSTMEQFAVTMDYETVMDIILSGKYNTIGIYDKLTDIDYEKGNQLLDEFRLNYIKDDRFSTLSEGEKRRTLIARAFMSEPEMMVLDEPCSSLDIRSREELLNTLNNKYKDNEEPLIYVTHNIDEIIPNITHVAIMDEGRIIDQGLKKDVLTEDKLSKLYNCNVELDWSYDRPWLKVKW